MQKQFTGKSAAGPGNAALRPKNIRGAVFGVSGS
jgi:hypothetical protein